MKPACSQCIRVFANCPGYRDPLDLIFRDERPKAERKADLGQHSNPTLHTYDGGRDHDGIRQQSSISIEHNLINVRSDRNSQQQQAGFHGIDLSRAFLIGLPQSIPPVSEGLAEPLVLHYFAAGEEDNRSSLAGSVQDQQT